MKIILNENLFFEILICDKIDFSEYCLSIYLSSILEDFLFIF